jgi:hypothetical protein
LSVKKNSVDFLKASAHLFITDFVKAMISRLFSKKLVFSHRVSSIVPKFYFSTDFLQDEVSTAREGVVNEKSGNVYVSEEALRFREFFFQRFSASASKSWNAVNSGSYVKLAEEDLSKYLPEGVCPSLKKDFEMTSQKMWMIRDVTKLSCRFLDESMKKLKNSSPSKLSSLPENGLLEEREVVDIPNLTDREEWDSCKVKCYQYGKPVVELDEEEQISLREKNEKSFESENAVLKSHVSFSTSPVVPLESVFANLPDKLFIGGIID